MTWRSDLRGLSDNELLARWRALPRADSGRAVISEVLVERYAHLVQACVRPYRHSPEPVEDLMQVGYLGLLKAINGFDPEIGDSHAHLEELPEREQRILALRFYGNLTQGEIGQRLGISQMHVSRLLSRALAYLRDKVTSEAGDGAVTPRRLGAEPAYL